MLWFRRKKKTQEQAPQEAASPPSAQEAPQPLADSGDTSTSTGQDLSKPRRRRGTRGGRGRKKPSDGAPSAVAERAEPATPVKPERKPSRPERGASSRQRAPRRRIEPKRALPAAKRELLISVDVSEQRVAVIEDDRVAEVYLERPERRSIAGNIYLGTVDNVLPGMEAAFVEIGLEKNGFLYVDEIVVPELEGKRHGKKIQDLIARGQTILVQAVKDPMKTKGARLTTEISLPGRFVVFVPNGEGLGVSRRLPDDERVRLKETIKSLEVSKGGVIVRTAAEGASAEDVERDLVFLQRLWKTIETRAKTAKAPSLVYQEAELPLRVVRDLFAGDFTRAVVDHERTHKRVVGYLKKTSPHMVERVVRYKEKTPLFEGTGVEAEIRSTLSRRVDLPSGGYLVFDYAEAFTVIDVNTGRFVGSRSKSSGARLEDTITKNNLEAVKEVVRQLRLRDVGGIIVIDFIDMANPKNRAAVEEALRTELERDRTKTYVVEISPLGLVEMTRQNVTEGPREILTRKCPTCSGDGVVLSEASAAVDVERKLRVLAASRPQAFRVELHPRVASLVIGPGATRLAEIEAQTKRRFLIETVSGGHALDHFDVLAQGKLDDLRPAAPVAEAAELELKPVELALHDASSAVGKVDGYDVVVGNAAALVGKKIKVRVERALHDAAYATWLDAPAPADAPLTAEAEAEKPTRQPSSRRGKQAEAPRETEPAAEGAHEADAAEAAPEPSGDGAETADETADEPTEGEAPKKRTRRGSRGGRGRKRKPAAEAVEHAVTTDGRPEQPDAAPVTQPREVRAPSDGGGARIHLPGDDLGVPSARAAEIPEQAAADADGQPDGGEAAAPKRTRRGSRGGRNRRKATSAATVAAAEPTAPEPEAGGKAEAGEWDYVPMSEWEDEVRA